MYSILYSIFKKSALIRTDQNWSAFVFLLNLNSTTSWTKLMYFPATFLRNFVKKLNFSEKLKSLVYWRKIQKTGKLMLKTWKQLLWNNRRVSWNKKFTEFKWPRLNTCVVNLGWPQPTSWPPTTPPHPQGPYLPPLPPPPVSYSPTTLHDVYPS